MNIIDPILKNQVDKENTPSVQYIFFDQNEVIHEFQYGYLDIAIEKKIVKYF